MQGQWQPASAAKQLAQLQHLEIVQLGLDGRPGRAGRLLVATQILEPRQARPPGGGLALSSFPVSTGHELGKIGAGLYAACCLLSRLQHPPTEDADNPLYRTDSFRMWCLKCAGPAAQTLDRRLVSSLASSSAMQLLELTGSLCLMI
jgi:hypothetical protein